MECGSVEHAKLIRMMIERGKYLVVCQICGAKIMRELPNADTKASKKS